MARPFRRRLLIWSPWSKGKRSGPTSIGTLGLDLGKTVCSRVGLGAACKVVIRKHLRRASLVAFVLNLDRCVVAMQACCGAHHLGRVFDGAEFDVRLMSPEYVKLYVKADKNDDCDAETIAEAATRPTMRFVRIKGECPELCVSGPVHAVSDTQASKRSPNVMANWLRAANHFLTFLPSFSKLRMAR